MSGKATFKLGNVQKKGGGRGRCGRYGRQAHGVASRSRRRAAAASSVSPGSVNHRQQVPPAAPELRGQVSRSTDGPPANAGAAPGGRVEAVEQLLHMAAAPPTAARRPAPSARRRAADCRERHQPAPKGLCGAIKGLALRPGMSFGRDTGSSPATPPRWPAAAGAGAGPLLFGRPARAGTVGGRL